MFVKNSLALQDTVDHILIIFERLIINLGRLEEVAKLQQWRDAVRDIRGELEAVRSIANRTDNVPHMLIGVDKYIHWTKNISTPGIPFPNWHQALFPPIKSIAGHPWLLTIKWCTWSAKGKAQDTPEELVAISEEKSITQEDNNGDESEVVEEDIKMDEAIIEPASSITNKVNEQEGLGKRGGRSYDPTSQSSIMSDVHQAKDVEDSPAPPPRKKPCLLKTGQTDPSLSSVQPQRVNAVIHQQDQMLRHINEGERQVQDNSTQTHQVDMDATVTSSNVVKMQHKTVQSPHSEVESREVTPTHREPAVVGQSVGMLSTESSDSGGQDHLGDPPNIGEATTTAEEAKLIIVAQSGIGGEHHQMMGGNFEECAVEGEGHTAILYVMAVAAIREFVFTVIDDHTTSDPTIED
ncbi:hypothetical protein EDD16DRAFT_1521057 [Pisolithus croceorrhizus]|nr:hypothetical protein EDD16DRAFT_1521057 [Pisolithus croceorrhizus]